MEEVDKIDWDFVVKMALFFCVYVACNRFL